MLRPHGYVTVYGERGLIEHDSITCGHCNRIVFVKPGSASTVYVLPQLTGPPLETPGAMCHVCMRAVCLSCHEEGRCLPLERRIEQMEARGRMLKAAGV
jgi:hypothetical protein